MASKHFVLKREGGFYTAKSNNFDFLKLISTSTPSTLPSESSCFNSQFNSREGMASLTYSKFSPPLMSLFLQQGSLYPGMTNKLFAKDFGNFVSIFVS